MIILVDYDNLPRAIRDRGLLHIATGVINRVADLVSDTSKCRVRLYGGWYNGNVFTHNAQTITSEAQATFPCTVRWQTPTRQGASITQTEMAYSLEVEPTRHLFFTFRTRPFTTRLQCDASAYQQCGEVLCPLQNIETFFNQQKCPTSKCSVRQGDLLRKGEQKLVDTMLTSDLAYLASKSSETLVVVSSDDDLWPGIRTAIGMGARVILLHTRRNRPLPQDYTHGIGTQFSELTI